MQMHRYYPGPSEPRVAEERRTARHRTLLKNGHGGRKREPSVVYLKWSRILEREGHWHQVMEWKGGVVDVAQSSRLVKVGRVGEKGEDIVAACKV